MRPYRYRGPETSATDSEAVSARKIVIVAGGCAIAITWQQSFRRRSAEDTARGHTLPSLRGLRNQYIANPTYGSGDSKGELDEIIARSLDLW